MVIAHNIVFDFTVIKAETLREMLPRIFYKEIFDTMIESQKYLTLWLPFSILGYKHPKLCECYTILFNEILLGNHDALSDVKACARVYSELLELNKKHNKKYRFL